jgi:hypothetical protein
VLRASEKDPEGRERKGGGKGRGVRLAKRARPVSNLKGRLRGSDGGDESGGGLSGRARSCRSEVGFSGGLVEEPSRLLVSLLFELLSGLENMDAYREKCRDDATVGHLGCPGCRAE